MFRTTFNINALLSKMLSSALDLTLTRRSLKFRLLHDSEYGPDIHCPPPPATHPPQNTLTYF